MIKKALCAIMAFCMLFTMVGVTGAVAANPTDVTIRIDVANALTSMTSGGVTYNNLLKVNMTLADIDPETELINTVSIISLNWDPNMAAIPTRTVQGNAVPLFITNNTAWSLATPIVGVGEIRFGYGTNGGYVGYDSNFNPLSEVALSEFYIQLADDALDYGTTLNITVDESKMIGVGNSEDEDKYSYAFSDTSFSFDIPDNRLNNPSAITDKTVTYDGNAHTVEVTGAPQGSTVTYTSNGNAFTGATAPGTYPVTAKVTCAGYKPFEKTVNLVINKKELTVSGLTATDRAYNGTTDVTLSGGSLVGVVGSEDVSVVAYPTAGTLADKNAGSNKAVSFSPIVLTGADKDNYAITQPTVTANIDKAVVVVTGKTLTMKQAQDVPTELYDITSGQLYAGDVFAGSALIEGLTADKNAATYPIKQGTLALSDNYQLTFNNGSLTINLKDDQTGTTSTLPVAINATYGDAETTATLTIDSNVAGAAVNAVSSDEDVATVTYSNGTITVTPKNAGTATVTITVAGNETYADKVIPCAVTVAKKALTAAGLTATNKVYDGTTDVAITGTLEGILNGDEVILPSNGTLASKNVGTHAVSVPELSGADAANYSLTIEGVTATVSPKTISATVTAEDKVYDGSANITATATLADVVNGDNVTSSVVASVYSKNAASYVNGDATVTLEGDDAANYTLAQSSFSNVTVTINPKALTVTGLTAVSRKADDTTTVALTGGTLTGVVDGDDVSATMPTEGTIESANPGSNKAVTIAPITLSGADAINYTLTTPTDITVNITSAGGNNYRPSSNLGGGTTTPDKDEDNKDDETTEDLTKATADVSLKENASEIKFIEASEDGSFNADADATRNDVVKALDKVLDIENTTGDFDLTDVEGENAEIVELFTRANIIAGYEDGTFRGENTITRAEFLKILAVALGVEVKEYEEDKFDDIKNHWSANYVNSFVELGYILGYPDGTFRPDNSITLAEMVIVINRVVDKDVEAADKDLSEVTGLDANHWAYNDIMASIQ